MLSDIMRIYPDEGRTFLPFLTCPIGDNQDSVIFASQSIAAEHESFLTALSVIQPNHALQTFLCRSFLYEYRVACYIRFPTSETESGSRRSGLNVTIGLIVGKNAWTDFAYPLSTFLPQFVRQVKNVLDVDLTDGDPGGLIRLLNRESFVEDTKAKIDRLSDLLLAIEPLRKKNARRNTGPTIPIRRPGFSFPKVVLANGKSATEMLAGWCQSLDDCITKLGPWKFDVASDETGSNISSMRVVLVDLPELSNASRTELRASPSPHIALW